MSKENAQEFSFKWNLKNFSFDCYKFGDAIESPIFKIDSFGGSQWCLILYPRGVTEQHNGYMSIFLCKKKNDTYSELSSIIFEIELDFDNSKVVTKCSTSNYDYKLNERYGWSRLIQTTSVSSYQKKWPKSVLTLRCHMFNTRKQRCFDLEMQSEISVNRSSFLWNVKTLDVPPQLVSKEFSFSEKSLYEITLSMPDNETDAIKFCIRQKEENYQFPKFIECKLSVVNSKKNELTSKRASHLFVANDKNDIWEFPNFINKKDLCNKSNFQENGVVSLFCEMVSSDGIKSLPVMSSKYHEDYSTELLKDIKTMFRNHIHSDFQLKVNKEIINCHKSILGVRSPVFLAMFDRDMMESKTGVVDIPDLELNTLKVFLEFIYTGTVDNFDYDKARKLLVVADKYQVQSLTEKCASFLEVILSVENAIEILFLANKHNHEHLKNAAMHFIARNSEVVFRTPEWGDLLRENVELAGDMLSIIASNFKIVHDG